MNMQDEKRSMRKFSATLTIVLPLIASAICGTIGHFAGGVFDHGVIGAFVSASISFGAYLACEIYIANEKEATVLQLLGKYSRCLNEDGFSAGIKLVAWPFEKVFNVVKVKQDFPIKLYRDKKEKSEVDFKDGSSPMTATAWVRVEKPVKFTYEITDPDEFIENYVDSVARPEFATRTIDEGNADKSDIAAKCIPLISRDLLAKSGAALVKLFIEDFDFPEEVKKTRAQMLVGESEAKRIAAKFDGVILSIANIAKGLISGGMAQDQAIEQARMIFFEQTAMETVREATSNNTFIAEGVKGMLSFFASTGHGSPKGGK